MAAIIKIASVCAVVLLLVSNPVAAQRQWGELTSTLTGTIAPSYSGTYGNMTQSTHAWALGGSANYAGSFHNPNFLSFSGNAYLNQSRANSNYQSISNASGFNLSSTIFAGSNFPGSVSYSRAYNAEGNYSIPGAANYVTHGNSDTFGVTWSENLPDAPSFSAGYQRGSSSYSVYGLNNDGASAFQSLNLHSSYRVEQFNMGAFYLVGNSHAHIPQVIVGQSTTVTHSFNDGFGFNIMHPLPLKGAASGSVTRTNFNSTYLGYRSSGTIDLFNGLATIHPWQPFSMAGTVSYSDNLSGQIYQQYAAGGVLPGVNLNQKSNSLDMMLSAGYNPTEHLQTGLSAERRTQEYEGQNYGVTSYGGSAGYVHTLRVGSVSASVAATDNLSDKTSNNTLGFTTMENYSGEFKHWNLSSSFGYSQNVQTLLVTYMNSSYHVNVTARRNFGNLFFSSGASMARTALSQTPDTSSGSESFNGTLGYSRYLTVAGSYAQADGQALATGAGLVPVQPPFVPSNLVFFGGHSYAFSASSNPVRKLIMSASWSRSNSNTSQPELSTFSTASQNETEQFDSLVQYQFRKMNFNGGYARLQQGFSNAGAPQTISSYSVGVSRWFNVF